MLINEIGKVGIQQNYTSYYTIVTTTAISTNTRHIFISFLFFFIIFISSLFFFYISSLIISPLSHIVFCESAHSGFIFNTYILLFFFILFFHFLSCFRSLQLSARSFSCQLSVSDYPLSYTTRFYTSSASILVQITYPLANTIYIFICMYMNIMLAAAPIYRPNVLLRINA